MVAWSNLPWCSPSLLGHLGPCLDLNWTDHLLYNPIWTRCWVQLITSSMIPITSWPKTTVSACPQGSPLPLYAATLITQATVNVTLLTIDPDPHIVRPVLTGVKLSQTAPRCLTNKMGKEPVGNLTTGKCNQTLYSQKFTHLPITQLWCWLNGYLHPGLSHSSDKHCTQQSVTYSTLGSIYPIKKSH